MSIEQKKRVPNGNGLESFDKNILIVSNIGNAFIDGLCRFAAAPN